MSDPKRPPCVLCGEPLPAMFGGAYDKVDGPIAIGGARCWCCPTCCLRLGWRRARNRALSILRSLLPRENAP